MSSEFRLWVGRGRLAVTVDIGSLRSRLMVGDGRKGRVRCMDGLQTIAVVQVFSRLICLKPGARLQPYASAGNPPAWRRFSDYMVKINKVTTYVGDDGSTVLGDGTRLPKFHPRLAALGAIDEANAFIGLASHYVSEKARPMLERIQNDLLDLGADLCTPERPGAHSPVRRFGDMRVAWVDDVAKAANAGLPALPSFVLPNGTLGATHLHVARACIRRAEREIVEVSFQAPLTPAILKYINRLSDLLFILARVENDSGAKDRLWTPNDGDQGAAT